MVTNNKFAQNQAQEVAGAVHTPIDSTRPTAQTRQQASFGPRSVYAYNDQHILNSLGPVQFTPVQHFKSMDELLQRDARRQQDGFPQKIKIGRLIRPSRGGKEKIVVVPTTVEEKFYHDSRPQDPAEEGLGSGSGEGAEGEVIGEEPQDEGQGPGQGGSGQGQGESHEIESNAYDLGRILTEQFELPNLKDKGKKAALKRYVYDLTDRHKGNGQILDKKATLKKIIETNLNLNQIAEVDQLNPPDLLVSPADMVYRILSKEKEYESQAMVFFVRDYSGSMTGKPTETVASQHVLLYSWLLYQYEHMVETRFILHDTEAREVADFYTYYNSMVAGGTKVGSAFKLVNEIVTSENLARDYNLYLFYGTDGDDWDAEGQETIPELRKLLTVCNRIGLTVVSRAKGNPNQTTVENYIRASNLLQEHPDLLRLDSMATDADENRLIAGIKKLIS